MEWLYFLSFLGLLILILISLAKSAGRVDEKLREASKALEAQKRAEKIRREKRTESELDSDITSDLDKLFPKRK